MVVSPNEVQLIRSPPPSEQVVWRLRESLSFTSKMHLKRNKTDQISLLTLIYCPLGPWSGAHTGRQGEWFLNHSGAILVNEQDPLLLAGASGEAIKIDNHLEEALLSFLLLLLSPSSPPVLINQKAIDRQSWTSETTWVAVSSSSSGGIVSQRVLNVRISRELNHLRLSEMAKWRQI